MSVDRIRCPECAYELLYATLGSKGSYRTDRAFAASCRRAGEMRPENAMSCPVLRAAAESRLGVKFPGGGPPAEPGR